MVSKWFDGIYFWIFAQLLAIAKVFW